ALLARCRQRVRGNLGGERQEVIGEVEAARNSTDHRHENVVDEGIDDFAESKPDDYRNGKVEGVGLQGKFPEILPDAHLVTPLGPAPMFASAASRSKIGSFQSLSSRPLPQAAFCAEPVRQ